MRKYAEAHASRGFALPGRDHIPGFIEDGCVCTILFICIDEPSVLGIPIFDVVSQEARGFGCLVADACYLKSVRFLQATSTREVLNRSLAPLSL